MKQTWLKKSGNNKAQTLFTYTDTSPSHVQEVVRTKVSLEHILKILPLGLLNLIVYASLPSLSLTSHKEGYGVGRLVLYEVVENRVNAGGAQLRIFKGDIVQTRAARKDVQQVVHATIRKEVLYP